MVVRPEHVRLSPTEPPTGAGGRARDRAGRGVPGLGGPLPAPGSGRPPPGGARAFDERADVHPGFRRGHPGYPSGATSCPGPGDARPRRRSRRVACWRPDLRCRLSTVSSTVADLEIATYGIDGSSRGRRTGRDGTTLSVSSSQLAVGAGEPALAEATVEVVRPGEPVRISNVLDVVLPTVKADDPTSTFPGVLGPAADAGTGLDQPARGGRGYQLV